MSARGKPAPKRKPAAQGANTSAPGGNVGVVQWTTDAAGLKIGPTTVLVMSLLFIGSVVLLHIWGKLTSQR